MPLLSLPSWETGLGSLGTVCHGKPLCFPWATERGGAVGLTGTEVKPSQSNPAAILSCLPQSQKCQLRLKWRVLLQRECVSVTWWCEKNSVCSERPCDSRLQHWYRCFWRKVHFGWPTRSAVRGPCSNRPNSSYFNSLNIGQNIVKVTGTYGGGELSGQGNSVFYSFLKFL